MKKNIPVIFISLLIFISTCGIAHATMNYTLLESFPGFFTAGSTGPDLPTMILAIYKFGIWTVGIAGLFMLVIGGFWYMTSAGNTSTAETAKTIIWDSLLGIVAALAAYLIMYVINPDLTKISISFISVSTTTSTTSTSTGTTTAATASTTATGGACSGGSCTQIDSAVSSNSNGINAKVLKTILAGGEGCSSRVSDDGYGSCGYSQALPTIRTACGISGTNSETCTKIQADVQLDINCAAWLINSQSGSCPATDYFAAGCCYNGGPSNSDCHKNTSYGTKLTNFYGSYCQ